MSLILIASAAIATLGPYILKGGEEISKSVAKDLYESIKKRFSSPEEKKVLEKIELSNHEDPDLDTFRNMLSTHLQNPTFQKETIENVFLVLNKLLNEDRLPEYFTITDKFIVDNQYSRLKREFVSGKYGYDFADRLKVYTKTYFTNHFS